MGIKKGGQRVHWEWKERHGEMREGKMVKNGKEDKVRKLTRRGKRRQGRPEKKIKVEGSRKERWLKKEGEGEV